MLVLVDVLVCSGFVFILKQQCESRMLTEACIEGAVDDLQSKHNKSEVSNQDSGESGIFTPEWLDAVTVEAPAETRIEDLSMGGRFHMCATEKTLRCRLWSASRLLFGQAAQTDRK